MNPENKCAQLEIDKDSEKITIEDMFQMQQKLQDFLAEKGRGQKISDLTFREKISALFYQKGMVDLEFAELAERLPYKTWKNYSEQEKEGWTSEEQRLETLYEYVDMFHFFMNIGLLLGIDGKTFKQMYYAKNKENFDRQKRGY